MDIHRQRVELLQAVHALQKQQHHTTSLNSFDRARKKVGGHGFEVLKNAHPVCVSQNLLGFLIVDVANLVESDEQLERILLVRFSDASLDFLLNFRFPLLPVASESQKILLVCP